MSRELQKFCPERAQKIIEMVRKGHYHRTAAAAVRINERSLFDWVQKGEAGKEPYAAFTTDLLEAEAEGEDKLLAEIRSAKAAQVGVSGADVWQARAWILERRWPKRWNARVKATVQQEIDSFINRLRADPELYERVVDLLSKTSGDPHREVLALEARLTPQLEPAHGTTRENIISVEGHPGKDETG